MTRKTNAAGVALIKAFEGLADGDPATVKLDPYLCPAQVATIGWGHAITLNGKQLTGAKGLTAAKRLFPEGITLAEAEALLAADLVTFERDVARLVCVPLSDNQFAALVSFHFNTGKLGGSTLLRKLNAGDHAGAAEEFGRWVTAKGKRLPGLVRRRAAERQLFLRKDGQS